jgi:ABC-type oligopeptide transport system substrate-binding subunit
VNPGHRRIAEHLAERWAAVLGIRVVPRFVEWQEFVQKMTAGDYDVARAGWVLDYFDPQAALDMWTSWSTQNHTGWSDARFDLFLELAGDVFAFGDASRPEQQEVLRVVRDEDHVRTALERLRTAKPAERLAAATHLRLALLREAEAVMVQEGFPVIPLYQYVTHGAIGQVEGFHTMLTGPDGDRRPNVEGLHPLRDLFVRR